MPATVNGIGTHYYGKKNLTETRGVCDKCNRETTLRSYDTRLWFVILFLPVLPLGKKRILDYCSSCTSHRAADLDTWHEIKQNTLVERMQAVQKNPDDPGAAIELHRACFAFDEFDKAKKMEETLREKFAEDARVLQYLAGVLSFQGREAEAQEMLRRAHEKDPELEGARGAVALEHIREGRLDEARAMLAKMEPQPALLVALGVGYQGAGDHPRALEIFQDALGRAPGLATDKEFRKLFKASEAAAAVSPSRLPAIPGRFRLIRNIAVAVAVVMLGLFAANYYLSQNHKVHVVSGLDETAVVEFEGHGEYRVPASGRITVSLPEGSHTARVRGPAEAEHRFTIASGVADRFFGSRLRILNIASSAVLLRENTLYSVHPGADEGNWELLFGKPWYEFGGIDYVFEEFPEQITISDRESSVSKSRIDLLGSSVPELFHLLTQENRTGKALHLAEWWLPSHPEETGLLASYLDAARATSLESRASGLLKTGLQRRPVLVEWHRIYQSSWLKPADMEPAIREYDKWLAREPDNADLLYLRGRISPGNRKSRQWQERALQADPDHAYAHGALGYALCSVGEWKAARKEYEAAARSAPDSEMFLSMLCTCRLALGETDDLEKELRKRLEENPFDGRSVLTRIYCLTTTGRNEDAMKCAHAYEKEVRKAVGEEFDYSFVVVAEAMYAAGDFAGLEQLADASKSESAPLYRFRALVEQGKLEAAQALASEDPLVKERYGAHLALFLAWRLANRTEEAKAALGKAVELLRAGLPELAAAAELLTEEGTLDMEKVLDAGLGYNDRTTLLAALVLLHPDRKEDLLPALRKVNRIPEFPHHLVGKVTGE